MLPPPLSLRLGKGDRLSGRRTIALAQASVYPVLDLDTLSMILNLRFLANARYPPDAVLMVWSHQGCRWQIGLYNGINNDGSRRDSLRSSEDGVGKNRPNPSNATAKPGARVLMVLGIVCIAWVVRMRAVALLPIDYDEDHYLRAAQLYARIIRSGDWRALPQVTFNHEHPPLAKLAFGLAIAGLPPAPEIPESDLLDPPATELPQPHLSRARTLSALLGTLAVALLALLNPLAGLFMAVDTFAIKYTSLVMLEALPALTSAMAVVAYERARLPTGKGRRGWLALSAVAMGLTIASKYVYGVAGIAILIHWVATDLPASKWQPKGAWRLGLGIVGWGLLAALVFLAGNPYLWVTPWDRLVGSLTYHAEFSSSFLVEVMALPFFQPILWLLMWVPWQPEVFPLGLDPLITILAAMGFVGLWRTRLLYALWIAVGLGFLFLWPTKWPQYILVVIFPWALAAANGFQSVLWPRIERWREQRGDRA